MEIFKLLNESPIVISFDVIDYKKWKNGRYYRIKVILSDNSILYVREYVDETDRDYSFHWQTADNELIIRWDNAHHHTNLKTYPNHKHVSGEVVESYEISLADVLEYIRQHFGVNSFDEYKNST